MRNIKRKFATTKFENSSTNNKRTRVINLVIYEKNSPTQFQLEANKKIINETKQSRYLSMQCLKQVSSVSHPLNGGKAIRLAHASLKF